MVPKMKCEDRVAIVTGAAGNGMGRSIALTLAREGARVIINYRSSEESAKAIVDYIRSRRGAAIAVQADVFEADGCKKLFDLAIDRFNQIDICIIGPGAGWHPEPIHLLDSPASLEDIHREIAPVHYLMPLVLPGMYERKWGRLIGIALHPTNLPPAYSYNVGKAARMQALLLAQGQAWQHGVTVNVIGPSPVPAIDKLEEAIEQCEHGLAWQKRNVISPQDIAEGVAFLCSEAGRFITGCVLPYH
jgi:NAD(P)-dependent dehydrogenase (short-subunit alcohol dehydrogenase family)